MMLTIFTPTYNRAYCLGTLYRSLCNQTVKDFVWLIVDDGSTDNTEAIIKKYIDEAKINIQYINQLNAGKHVATNTAIERIDTELFVCVDSDDYLSDNAVEIVLEKYKNRSINDILGIYFRRIHKDGSNVAGEYPENVKSTGITELYHRYGFTGDTMMVLLTKYLKAVRFPVFAGEKFVTERVLYNKLDRIAPMLLQEDGIYISEYLDDGYTRNAHKLAIKNPYGSSAAFLSESFYGCSFTYKVKNYAQYLAFRDLFTLDDLKFSEFRKPNALIRMAACLFKMRYKRLYRLIYDEIEANK